MLYFCHQCQRTVQAEADQALRCSLCHGEFIEEANLPDDHLSDDHDEGAETMDLNDVFRFLNSRMGNGDQPQQQRGSSQSGSSRPQPAPSNQGFLSNIISSLMQGNPSSSSNSAQPGAPNPNSQPQQNAQPDGDAMMNFMNQIFANLASNAGPGVRVHFHFGEAPANSNINNYVFGDAAFDQLISHLLNQSELVQQGLTEDDMKELPKSKISSAQVENELQCTTCMETYAQDEEVVSLPCKHVFHPDCIFPWLKKQRTCPICRKEIPKKERPEAKITDIDELD